MFDIKPCPNRRGWRGIAGFAAIFMKMKPIFGQQRPPAINICLLHNPSSKAAVG